MRHLILSLLSITCVVGCVAQEPTLVSFRWSHDRTTEPDWDRFGEVTTRAVGDNMVATVWTTTYAHQDLKHAKGWLLHKGSKSVLYFSAPEPPPPPPTDGYALAGAAYPKLLTYEISGVSESTSLISYSEKCPAES